MKHPDLTFVVFSIFFSFAFGVAGMCGEVPNVKVAPHDGKFDLVVNGRALLEGMYPEIAMLQKEYSVADGSLVAGETTGPVKASGALGETEEWKIPYSDAEGKEMITAVVRVYPALSAAAVGFRSPGLKSLRYEGGIRLVIGGAPGFLRGMGAERFCQFWTRPAFSDKPEGFPPETQYIVWEDRAAGWGAAIPLVGGGMRTTFSPSKGRLAAVMASYDISLKSKGGPAAAFSWGGDPYAATRNLYRAGMDFMGNPGRLREEKKYPEIFEYIGWCSWNTYYQMVTQSLIFANARSFMEHHFPIKYFLVDDGWQPTRSSRLTSFDIVREKFPDGIDGLVSTLKNKYGIRWVGFWHTYQGYWDGVDPESELAKEYRDSLFESFTGALIPDPMERRGFRFFNDYHARLRAAGADFVKVDNQSTLSVFTMNKLPIGYAARGQQDNLQSSVDANFGEGAVINCMDMTIENIYFWRTSNVSRNSDDFFPDRPFTARDHAFHNIYNSMWFSELTWPDFDMLQSHHPQAQLHSVLRAVSGGPVYITDTPGLENWDMLRALVFSDGRVPRPDLPARPTRDVLTVDTMKDPVPLKAFNRVGGIGIIAAFNVYEGGGTIHGSLKPADVEGIEGDSFAVYEHFSSDLKLADSARDRIEFDVDDMSAKLFIVAPIVDGFAPIGATDKYISPKWIAGVERSGGEINVDLVESCVFGAYLADSPRAVLVNGSVAIEGRWSWNDSFLRVDVSETERPIRITIKK